MIINDLILSINGKPMRESQWREFVESLKPGQKLQIDTATATIRAQMAPQPGEQLAGNEAFYAHTWEQPGPRIAVVQDLDDPAGCMCGEWPALFARLTGGAA